MEDKLKKQLEAAKFDGCVFKVEIENETAFIEAVNEDSYMEEFSYVLDYTRPTGVGSRFFIEEDDDKFFVREWWVGQKSIILKEFDDLNEAEKYILDLEKEYIKSSGSYIHPFYCVDEVIDYIKDSFEQEDIKDYKVL